MNFFGRGMRFSLKGPINFLLGDWRILGIYSYQNSFNPFKDSYISPGSMSLPAAFTFGNAALNYNLRGFALYNEDMALAKSFRIKERFRCEFRWEAFNSLNRVVWATAAQT